MSKITEKRLALRERLAAEEAHIMRRTALYACAAVVILSAAVLR